MALTRKSQQHSKDDCPDQSQATKEIVDNLILSYEELRGINLMEDFNLPNREAVKGITEDLLKLVFPGFYEEDRLHSSALVYHVGDRIASLTDRLTREVEKSLNYQPFGETVSGDARTIVCQFLRTLPEIRQLLQKDVVAAFEGDPAAMSEEEVILAYPGVEAIAVQRLAHYLYKEGVRLIPRMMTEIAHANTGIDIHPGAEIGEYFFIDHGTGVVIGETSSIGDRVKIYQGVTLGAKSFKKDAKGLVVKGGKRHPTIENEVTIYAGATILGGDTTIGQGSVIGGNVWLLDSVPPYTMVTYQDGETRTASMVANLDVGGGI